MINPYKITFPSIPTAGVYYFATEHDVQYEVRFGRKQNDVLSANIVFGVLNEEYDGEEYVVTNKGDVFRVMNTIARIVTEFMLLHPNVRSYEFVGEPSDQEQDDDNHPTKRTKLYRRYINKVFGDEWKVYQDGSKIVIRKD